jgi:DNA-directed RNA polymerase subunit M/transcription elongation factor TFIIS
MSKGSSPRPFSVSNQDYANRWDAIFGKDKTTECPKCGADDYESVKTKPGQGDPSKTYCLCNQCGNEFDGKTIWD